MPILPDDPVLRGYLLEALEAQARLRAAEAEAEQQRAIFREAARRAHSEGATLRVIGAALGLSFARVHQIVSQPPAGGA